METRMSDPKAIDISPEAVGAVLDDMRSGQNELDAMGLISALSAALSEARGKVGEAERETDEATKYAKTLCESFVHEHCSPVETWKVLPDLIGVLTQIYNATTVVRSIKAERDAALSELAKAKAEAECLKSAASLLLLFAVKPGVHAVKPKAFGVKHTGDLVKRDRLITFAATFGIAVPEHPENASPLVGSALPSPSKDPAHER